MKNIANIFQEIPRDLPEEITEVLTENKQVRIERIISRGHSSPQQFWYDQPQDEFVLLLRGEATLLFRNPDIEIRLQCGDYLLIPARRQHRVTWTASDEDTIWLAVHIG